jgi:hypothetical protein
MDVIKIIMDIDQNSLGDRGCKVPSAITILVENNLTVVTIVHFFITMHTDHKKLISLGFGQVECNLWGFLKMFMMYIRMTHPQSVFIKPFNVPRIYAPTVIDRN